jgi:hypothetical protein
MTRLYAGRKAKPLIHVGAVQGAFQCRIDCEVIAPSKLLQGGSAAKDKLRFPLTNATATEGANRLGFSGFRLED